MDSSSTKRQHPSGNDSPTKKPKLSNGSGPSTSGGKMSFAQRMMAKMGHQEGTGLGREAQGIVNPIQVKMRPQGAGVGAVDEKVADPREKKAGKETKDKKPTRTPRDSSSPAPRRSAPVKKARTTIEIEAGGLRVPDAFKNLIDMTGGVMTAHNGLAHHTVPLVSEAQKIKSHAQRELEAFADAWAELKDRNKYLAQQESQLQQELYHQQAGHEQVQRFYDAVSSLEKLDLKEASVVSTMDDVLRQFELVVERLEDLQSEFSESLESNNLNEVAVAAICPVLKRYVSVWDPLETGHKTLAPLFKRISRAIGSSQNEALSVDESDYLDVTNSIRRATPYESMMFSIWLPSVRSAITTDWDVYDPTPMIYLISEWKDILPQFIYDVVVNQLIFQRLLTALESWRPDMNFKQKTGRPDAHVWIFPWLEFLDDSHLDPRNANGLFFKVKRKFRTAFDKSNFKGDLVNNLDRWCEVRSLVNEINRDMEYRLLPSLASYLNKNLDINPADQDVGPLETVMAYQKFFRPEKFGRVILDAFFPKWLQTLHLWLTSDPNYDEVGEWFSWWQSQFNDDIHKLPDVVGEWSKGSDLINQALDLGPERVVADLPLPMKRQDRQSEKKLRTKDNSNKEAKKPTSTTVADEPLSYKDLLEEHCENEGLLMVPLRKAHPESGQPLFRITASASGSGGIVVFMKGDALWVQNKKERSLWEPIDPFEPGLLLALAEKR